MAVQVDGHAMPARMAATGTKYDWHDPQIVAKNGRGRVVQAGYPFLVWEWEWLSASEWDYWITTVLAGAQDALLTGTTQLYDNNEVLRTISSCIVTKPAHDTIVNGTHRLVKLLIEQIVAT